jgi:hypothetical protein
MEVNYGCELDMEVNFGGKFQYGGEFRGELNMEANFGGDSFIRRIIKGCPGRFFEYGGEF